MSTVVTVQVELCDECGKKVKELAKENPSNRTLVYNAFMAVCTLCKMRELLRVTIGPSTRED